MPLVSMRQLLDHAAEYGYGIPAFNVNNLEQVQAVNAKAADVYRYMNFDQIAEFKEVADTVTV